MFGKKKQFTEQPLGYWEALSCFMIIPENKNKLPDMEQVVNAINNIDGFKVNHSKQSEKSNAFLVNFDYDGEEYEGVFDAGGFSLPESYLYTMRNFTQAETEKLKNANSSMNFSMRFTKNPKKFYHIQLKIAAAVIPDLIALIDESAEKVLQPKWVKLAAKSKVVPAAQDLFTIQGVSGAGNSVWLHTHGLCRFGLTEIEILDSDREHCNDHYNLLSAYGSYLLDMNEDFDPHKDVAFIGLLEGNTPIVAICRSWTEALSEYKKLELGGEKDRENAHNSKTSPVFLYKSEDDMKNDVLSKVSIYNDKYPNNPVYFFSNEETERMKALAQERFDYARKAFEDKENKVLIKIGLQTDGGKAGEKEHVWFELVGVNGDKFTAKLTHEAYDVSGIHTGDEREFEVSDITDWMIFTKEFPVSPNDVYLLEVRG